MKLIYALLYQYKMSVAIFACTFITFCSPRGNWETVHTKYILPRDALVLSAVLRLHVVRPSARLSVCLSICNVGGSGSHRL